MTPILSKLYIDKILEIVEFEIINENVNYFHNKW